VKTEMNVTLAMPLRHVGGVELETYAFLTFVANAMDITPLAK